MKTVYKERRLYFYTCSKCGGTNRCSFKRAKAKKAVCRKCKRLAINKNQIPLFPDVKVTLEYLVEKRGLMAKDAQIVMENPELLKRYQDDLDLSIRESRE